MYTIRPARNEDYEPMISVLETVNMHHIPSIEVSQLDYQQCFVAERNVDNIVIGLSGWVMTSTDSAKTTLMAVLPECRGHGIGYILQAIRMASAHNAGADRMVSNADRQQTIAWYKQKFGYREIGKLPKAHEFGLTDVLEWTTLETDLKEWSRRHMPIQKNGVSKILEAGIDAFQILNFRFENLPFHICAF